MHFRAARTHALYAKPEARRYERGECQGATLTCPAFKIRLPTRRPATTVLLDKRREPRDYNYDLAFIP